MNSTTARDASKYAGTQYIGKDDLLDGPLDLVIQDVDEKTFPVKGNRPAEDALVLLFNGGRQFVLSTKLNVRILIEAYGRDWTQWVGERVVVYRDENVQFGHSLTGGNRVRVPQGPARQVDMQRDIAEAMPTVVTA